MDQAAAWGLGGTGLSGAYLPSHATSAASERPSGLLGLPQLLPGTAGFPTALTLMLFLHAVLGGQSRSKYTCLVHRLSSPAPGSPPATPLLPVRSWACWGQQCGTEQGSGLGQASGMQPLQGAGSHT